MRLMKKNSENQMNQEFVNSTKKKMPGVIFEPAISCKLSYCNAQQKHFTIAVSREVLDLRFPLKTTSVYQVFVLSALYYTYLYLLYLYPRYLECNIKGQLRPHLCPDGFMFDISLEKCDYPVKVNCSTRPQLRKYTLFILIRHTFNMEQ